MGSASLSLQLVTFYYNTTMVVIDGVMEHASVKILSEIELLEYLQSGDCPAGSNLSVHRY